MVKNKSIIFALVSLLLAASAASVWAEKQIVDIDTLKVVALPLHLVELALGIFICVMALKLFRITKPFNFFLLVYTALGFFLINALLYVLLYTDDLFKLDLSFMNVYLGGRFSLIAMLASLSYLFLYIHVMMKKRVKEVNVR